MANRRMQQFTFSNIPMVSHVFAKVTFGSTGAPTLAATNNNFVTSVTRNSAGTYTFLLTDVWSSLIGVNYVFNSGSSAPASPSMYVKADNVATAATRTLQIVFNAAGTATDPASGEIVYLDFVFKNSTAF